MKITILPLEKWVDLHMHSTMSDGSLTPEEMVRLAYRRQIKTISLTDHDTLAGIPLAQKEAEKYGIHIIPGIEISAIYPKGTMHILGYNIDIHSKNLQAKLVEYKNARGSRNEQIIEKLQNLGIDITFDDVLKVAGPEATMGRPHIANVLMAKGVVQDFREAFQVYLADNIGKAYVEKEIFQPQEAIDMIHDAGGKAFVAHPTSLYLEDEEIPVYFKELKEMGMDGMEIYTSAHNRGRMKKFRKYAEEFDFMISGGSDFHGSSKPRIKLGSCHEGTRIRSEWVSDYFLTHYKK
ncbi:MAG: putative metal-dependent phosphoesterase TrpH [bacterium]|jgi:predicted metal-dependent phosphoesterase TrpH